MDRSGLALLQKETTGAVKTPKLRSVLSRSGPRNGNYGTQVHERATTDPVSG